MENKKEDEIYCLECAKLVKKNAVVCPHCGIQLKELAISTAPTSSPKIKAVSVVLALFFGFWSWLYTYRKDQLKFWIFLGLLITTIYFAANNYGEATWILAINSIGWFWALIDAVRRPTIFFMDYPNA